MREIRYLFPKTPANKFFGREYANPLGYRSVDIEPSVPIEIDGQVSFDWYGSRGGEEIMCFLNNAGRNSSHSSNRNSLILHVRYGCLTFLLPGDATRETYASSSILICNGINGTQCLRSVIMEVISMGVLLVSCWIRLNRAPLLFQLHYLELMATQTTQFFQKL